MQNRRWLKALRAELAAQGIPKRHTNRLLDELADHTLDLMEEKTMNACGTKPETLHARLGQPAEVAEAAAVNYRKPRFAGRHPWLTFLVAPLPALILVWTAFVFVIISVFEGLPSILGDAYEVEGKPLAQWPTTLVWGLHGVDYSIRFVLPAVMVLIFCWLARRSGRRARWALLACGLIALFASGLQTTWEFPQAVGQQGRFFIGFGLSLSPHLPELIYFLQFAVPLGIGLAFLLLERRRWGRLQVD